MKDLLLVVDDSEDLRRIFRATLSRAGYAVVSTGSGPEALRFARQRHPRLILLDLAMPGMDGISVIEELKGDERTASIPVVAVTGYEVVVEELRRLGFLGVMKKPVGTRRLVEAVERARGAADSGIDWIDLRERVPGAVPARVRRLDPQGWERVRELLARTLGRN